MVKPVVLKLFAKKLKKGGQEVSGQVHVCPVCKKSFKGPTSFGDIHLHMIKHHEKNIQLGDEHKTQGNENEVQKPVGESCPLPDFEASADIKSPDFEASADIKLPNFEASDAGISEFSNELEVSDPKTDNAAISEFRNKLEVSDLKAKHVEDKQVSSADEKISIVSLKNVLPKYSTFTRIKVTEDLILVPRIKLKFIFGCQGGVYDYKPIGNIMKGILSSGFRYSRFFRKKIPLRYENIIVHYNVPTRTIDDDFEVLAEGYFYFRDTDLNSEELYVKFRKKLVEQLGAFQVIYFDTLYEVRISLEEDLSKMISGLSLEKPPTIVLKGLPCEWFADHQSMENVRAFFHTLGRLRNFDVDDNNVSIQFEDPEDCSKALKILSSCSLMMKKNNESRMVDYELTLKDLPDSCISQEMFTNNSAALKKDAFVPISQETFKGQDMHALMVRMTQVEEELKYLKAKMEASPAG